MRPALTGEEPGDEYDEAARNLGTSEAAVRALARTMRKRFGELLRAEVSRTVARKEDVEPEIRHLLLSLRG